MKCDRCEHEATVHEVMIKGGKKQERHLCEKCARQHGVSIAHGGTPITQLLTQFIASPAGPTPSPAAAGAAPGSKPVTVCPACGLAFAQFRNSGLLGCAGCYTAFEGLLAPMLARVHEGGTSHAGKRPRSGGDLPPTPAPAPPATAPGNTRSAKVPHTKATSKSVPGSAKPDPAHGSKPGGPPPRPPSGSAGSATDGAHADTEQAHAGSGAHPVGESDAALRRRLKEAIEAEQYELAATLRDEIARRQGRLPGPKHTDVPGQSPGERGGESPA